MPISVVVQPGNPELNRPLRFQELLCDPRVLGRSVEDCGTLAKDGGLVGTGLL